MFVPKTVVVSVLVVGIITTAPLFVFSQDTTTTTAPLESDGLIPGGVVCAASGAAPTKPQPLSMCHTYNDNSCGMPALDQENLEMFDDTMNVGLSCRTRGDIREHPIAVLYCLNSDPGQPEYLRPEPFLPEGIADGGDGDRVLWNQSTYQAFLADPASTTTVSSRSQGDTTNTLLICDDWAITQFGTSDLASASVWCSDHSDTWDCSIESKKIPDLAAPAEGSTRRTKTWADTGGGFIRESIFQGCGYMKSSPCLDGNGNLIPDRDRFMCGDDIVLPSTAYDPLSVEAMINDNDFGPPGLDDFGLKIVANRVCTDEELAALALLEPSQSEGMLPGTDSHSANEFSLYSPNCLRTAAQIQKYGFSKYADQALLDAYAAANASQDWTGPNLVRDEKCFGPGFVVATAVSSASVTMTSFAFLVTLAIVQIL